ncbi:glutamate synthase large subunit [SAR202 cluster bacterium AD-804-J14_MRT_500m]|nr:glutamate synthase large subunit [SAR202 cluster bacterium AD-804-J14_MRT_500m]
MVFPSGEGLYRPEFEHDSCGVGFVARISGDTSNDILKMALEGVSNLTHRGAVSADGKTGDGAGILTQIPHFLLQQSASEHGISFPKCPDDLAIGVMFLPESDLDARLKAQQLSERCIKENGVAFLGWRPVPIDPSALGDQAKQTMPFLAHLMVARPASMSRRRFRLALYLARKQMERQAISESIEEFYVASLSDRSLVYKGMMAASQLDSFYIDLQSAEYQTALALFHQRYSTNTFPTWHLAQPLRFLAHNGEINTLRGNLNWSRAREPETWLDDVSESEIRLDPLCQSGGSDSSALDNVLEALIYGGRSLPHSVAMLIPEGWENMPNINPQLRAFYQYQACVTEPWDGPAAIAFSDGVQVGATLDRNGLRPSRYKITSDGVVVLASEVGAVPLADSRVVEKGRLAPGQMLVVDTVKRRVFKNDQVKKSLARRKPYSNWLSSNLISLPRLSSKTPDATSQSPDQRLLRAYGFTTEELSIMLAPMAKGAEPTGSMGDDTPLAILSTQARLLYSYFKQRFAQVTNPPIDSLRERLVMSLDTYLGPRSNFLQESPDRCKLVHLQSPILTNEELESLKNLESKGFVTKDLKCTFPATVGPQALKLAVEDLCNQAVEAVDQGCNILVLSDRGVNPNDAGIPMLMALGAVHHRLLRAGKRMQCSLVCETAEARDTHHLACLIGYGAAAVNPYLAISVAADLANHSPTVLLSSEEAVTSYVNALEKQLLKVMSKMGISTLSGYLGAQLFDVVGVDRDVVGMCFEGTVSHLDGVGFDGIARETLARHQRGFFTEVKRLDDWGYYRYRRDGETHSYNPQMVRALHHAVESNDTDQYGVFKGLVEIQPPVNLRDLLRMNNLGDPVPLDEVEPAAAIVRRFASASMSLGALSPEAHETLAIAVNRIGARSNTGEGGEDSRRYRQTIGQGDSSNSRSKQIASGRFGVTPEYIAMADELEIKMAQGSKPGEGGQLPGHKVVEHIAAIRYTQPGVTLISPPPHHDIYSIEDLAQLIYDLKSANPRARVSVKLVSGFGVGTIAAGVVKAGADVVHLSGHDGGTGASPFSSIKNAGMPWELGLAETQQTLELNGLRDRVILRNDGGMRHAKDVMVAALLGAEEFSFGTSALVAIGCQMARQCHLNTCPVGIASQDPVLRAKFTGKPEHLIRYFFFVAEDIRSLMASMGARSMDDLIGRSDLLEQVEVEDHPKANYLDLSPLIGKVKLTGLAKIRWNKQPNIEASPILESPLVEKIVSGASGDPPLSYQTDIRNQDRAVGTRLSGEIAFRIGDMGMPDDSIDFRLQGSAGQSFGSFLVPGIRLTLVGEANDYVGKGIRGGEIVLKPPPDAAFEPHDAVILGNTALYGATGGRLFAAGKAGERFAVRNSGAWGVVEGAGHHCCEYMTGGVVVVIGETGYNFAAGMSGGIAYVWDKDGIFPQRLNSDMVEIRRAGEHDDVRILKALLERHMDLTQSPRAADVLANWDRQVLWFWRISAKTIEVPMAPREEQRQISDARLESAPAAD